MSSLSKELHAQTVTIDYYSLVRKVSLNIKETVGRSIQKKPIVPRKLNYMNFATLYMKMRIILEQ